jgi:transcriptional regulator with XRE-family HTH domain
VVLAISEVRRVVERVCARQDVIDACANRDLGFVIAVLNANGLTQQQIASLTGLHQNRLSDYKTGKHRPEEYSVFASFADGLGLPPAARRALGLDASSPNAAGMGVPQPRPASVTEISLEYPGTPAHAAGNVTSLWRADLADQNVLARGRIDPGAWNDASLRWLVGPADAPEADLPGGARVGMGDVERFQVTVESFRQLDDRFGGGHTRSALIQYLSVDGDRLLRGRFTGMVGSALFSSVAEATLLAAWMSYDSAPRSALAQRYFIQALALAQAAGDRLLRASILDAMSHQATFTGRFGEAANLARAARTGTAGVATATLTAHFHTMEARALARLGDARGCDRALAEAVREFERRTPEDDPGWIRYFDESELAAEFGHCLRDLGRAVDAARYAGRSVGAADGTGFVRSDFFATMVLADAHLAAGELEQGCATALRVLTAGEQIRSARCVNYLREFRQHLVRAGDATVVTDFHEQARGSRLWVIASRPDKAAAV